MLKKIIRKVSIMYSKILICLILAAILGFGLAGCGKIEDNLPVQQVNPGQKTDNANAGRKAELKYTEQFSIEYLDEGIKKLTDAESRVTILVPRGKEVPVEYKDFTVIHTPIQKVLYASMTQVCFLRPFNTLWDSVAAVTSPKDDWYIDEIKDGLDNGSITYVGDSYQPDFEKIQAINPELVVVYTGTNPQTVLINKLEELNIPYIVDNEYMENEGMGRMEWIKFIATLYDKDEEALDYFNSAVDRVEDMKLRVSNEPKPKVAWGLVYKGTIYVPNAGSFVGKMIGDAGGDYVFKDMGKDKQGSEPISIEKFYSKAKDADILIYPSTPSFVGTLENLAEATPLFKDMKSFKEEKVWAFQPWYYQVLDKADETIIDLAYIFHPSVYKGEKPRHHYKVEAK
jgi:iron complex transport system substrate-binding protein